MADKPVICDDDNPELAEEDFARNRPGAEVLPNELVAAHKNKGGRPRTSNRLHVTLRMPRPVIDHFKAEGPGWQTRAIAVLEREVRKAKVSARAAAKRITETTAEQVDIIPSRSRRR